MFVLLRKYATAGAAKGDNLELVSMLFKVHESLFYLLALKLIVNMVYAYKLQCCKKRKWI